MPQIDRTIRQLENDANRVVVQAWKQSLGNVELIAKEMAPVGHYGRSRGRPGKAGGDLRQSLRVVHVGIQAGHLVAQMISPLPYAKVQHDKEFHHPGLYTGAPGEKYAAKYYERSFEMIFGSGKDPLGKHKGSQAAGFQEILNVLNKG